MQQKQTAEPVSAEQMQEEKRGNGVQRAEGWQSCWDGQRGSPGKPVLR